MAVPTADEDVARPGVAEAPDRDGLGSGRQGAEKVGDAAARYPKTFLIVTLIV
jgi:hypothetical protein